MTRLSTSLPIIVCCVALLAACDSFDKKQAALEIRERVCKDWSYGCSDSTRVVIEDVDESGNGRQVRFKLVDRDDETPTLSAAYFEPQDDEWRFLLFEEPFKSAFGELAGRVATDSRQLSDALSQVKAAQRWFISIYGRYANSLSELDSVSYKGSSTPIEMTVEEGSGWQAAAQTRYVRCELNVPGQELPRCVGREGEGVGSDSGPLSTAFRSGG